MQNLSSYEHKKQQAFLADYQEQISHSLREINAVIRLLETPIQAPNKQEEIARKVNLANQIVEQVMVRLTTLDRAVQSLQEQQTLTELENHKQIRELMTHQLKEIQVKTQEWEYSA